MPSGSLPALSTNQQVLHFALKMSRATSSREVLDLLNNVGLVVPTAASEDWVYVGSEELSRILLQGPKVSLGKALSELVVNSTDALLEQERLRQRKPLSAQMPEEFFTELYGFSPMTFPELGRSSKMQRKAADTLEQLSMKCGFVFDEETTCSCFDIGHGQSEKTALKTVATIGAPNKEEKCYIGLFGVGSHMLTPLCGFKVIITKMSPEHAAEAGSSRKTEPWTILLEAITTPPENPNLEILPRIICLINRETQAPYTFYTESGSFPVLPERYIKSQQKRIQSGEAISEIPHGTFVRAIDTGYENFFADGYDINNVTTAAKRSQLALESRMQPTPTFTARISQSIPGLFFPMKVYNCRPNSKGKFAGMSEKPKTINGLLRRLRYQYTLSTAGARKKTSNLELRIPKTSEYPNLAGKPVDLRHVFTIGKSTLDFEIFVCRPSSSNRRKDSYLETSAAAVLSVKGQAQGLMSKNSLLRDLHIDNLKHDLIIHLNCDELTFAARQSLFTYDRSTVNKTSHVYDIIQKTIRDFIKSSSELRALSIARSSFSKSSINLAAVDKVVNSVLRNSSLKLPGKAISTPLADDDHDYLNFPTYINTQTSEKQLKRWQLGRRLRLIFTTDARSDFFASKRGLYSVLVNNKPAVSTSVHIHNGRLELLVSGSDRFSVGDRPVISVRFWSDIHTFLHAPTATYHYTFSTYICPKVPHGVHRKLSSRHAPAFIPLSAADWKKVTASVPDFDRFDVALYQSTGRGQILYMNADHPSLTEARAKATSQREVDTLNWRFLCLIYSTACSQIEFYLEDERQLAKQTASSSSDDTPQPRFCESLENQISLATKSVSRTFFQVLSSSVEKVY